MKRVLQKKVRKQRWRGDEKKKGTFGRPRLGDASSLGKEGNE